MYGVSVFAGITSLLIVVANPLASAIGIMFLFVVWVLVAVYKRSHRDDDKIDGVDNLK